MENIFEKVMERLNVLGVSIKQEEMYIIYNEIDTSKFYIFDFCGINKIDNEELENILINLTAYNILQNKNNISSNFNTDEKIVKSITEGDISISYETSNSLKLAQNSYIENKIAELKNRLIKYRRLQW